MQNAFPDFFFNKDIYIGNVIDDRVTSQISYGKLSNGIIPVTLTFTNDSKNLVTGKSVTVIQNCKSTLRRKTTSVTNNQGKITWQIAVDTADLSKKNLEVFINDPDYKYKHRFFLPEFSTDFDVQFFPESGVLLKNNLQSVTFKAIGKDGLSVEVTGKIYSDKNEEFTDFSSLNKGMGKFSFAPQTGDSYYAIIKSAAGIEKRFNLPLSQDHSRQAKFLFC